MSFDELFCDILPVIEKAAPVLSSLTGSPLGGIIFGLLATLVDANACNALEVSKKLRDDPDLFAKLAKLEASHSTWLIENVKEGLNLHEHV